MGGCPPPTLPPGSALGPYRYSEIQQVIKYLIKWVGLHRPRACHLVPIAPLPPHPWDYLGPQILLFALIQVDSARMNADEGNSIVGDL